MAGIYIHIPFCRQACHYCDFVFTTHLGKIVPFMQALHRELQLKSESINENLIETIYFGGGTPSVLGAKFIQSILVSISQMTTIDDQVEITVEVNPEDINEALLYQLLEYGVNRLSIGIQTLQNEILLSLNRTHTSQEAVSGLELSKKVGFKNISVDLMFGLPGQDLNGFLCDIQTLAGLKPEHISLYSLTIEPKTVFGRRVNAKQMQPPDEGLQSECFLKAEEYLENYGYEHYEISNYAQPGFRSRHNSSYWSGAPYIGLGPGAHSYDGKRIRTFNTHSTGKYIQDLQRGIIPETREVLKNEDLINEWIMTRIRQKEGLNLEIYQEMTGRAFHQVHQNVLRQMQGKDWFTLEGKYLRLTPNGKLYADSIALEFFS